MSFSLLSLVQKQDIFLLFYSILYGIMLNSMMGFAPFPWLTATSLIDNVAKGMHDHFYVFTGFKRNKALRRLILSFSILNLTPILCFAFTYLRIDEIKTGYDFFRYSAYCIFGSFSIWIPKALDWLYIMGA